MCKHKKVKMQANKKNHLFQPRVPQLEFEANRFRGSLLILGHTNKQIEITTFKKSVREK